MVKAFVFVDAAAGTAGDVVESVRAADGISEAHVVAGTYDVVVEVDAPAVRDLLSVVTREIRTVDGVGTTRTYVALE